jgi:hypothetical protein
MRAAQAYKVDLLSLAHGAIQQFDDVQHLLPSVVYFGARADLQQASGIRRGNDRGARRLCVVHLLQ